MDVCTIATSNYVAHARVLAESFLTHNRRSTIHVLVFDEDSRAALSGEARLRTLGPQDIGIDSDELHRRATMYNTQGLAASMKPDVLLALLRESRGPLLFIDADGRIYSDLDPLAPLCERHSLLLCPHSLDPYPLSRGESPEQVILRAGALNAGFVGAAEGAEEALRWWARRTRRHCVFEPQASIMFDQTWLTLAPCLFEHEILRDRGCNVAGWNLHTRDIEWNGQVPEIDGERLRHFHFAGSFDPLQPDHLTPIAALAAWWADLRERPGAAQLVREYAQRLLALGYERARSTAPTYTVTPAGVPIAAWMRECYRTALLQFEDGLGEEPPNPFSHGDERFIEWLEPLASSAARAQAPPSPEGNGSNQVSEALASALLDSRRALARIAELEADRDDAAAWAERVSVELRKACAEVAKATEELAKANAERACCATVIEQMRNSVSWRVTKPLRSVKAAVRRTRSGVLSPSPHDPPAR